MARRRSSPAEVSAPDTGKPLRADARRNRARVLDAAEAVFTARGASVSTEEIAREAGVGIGTVFRHFPTKESLLQAIIGARLQRLIEETDALVAEGDSATAFFTFFARMVEGAAAKKTFVDLLAAAGVDVNVSKGVHALEQAIGVLLTRAQQAGTVRDDVRLPEVMALLIGTCQGALNAGWERDVQERTLAIIFDGLRKPQ